MREKVSSDLPDIQVLSAKTRQGRKPETDELARNTQSGIEEVEFATATQRRVSRGTKARISGSLELWRPRMIGCTEDGGPRQTTEIPGRAPDRR